MVEEIRSYLDALLRYFDFSGRSSRAQFWLFHLVLLFLVVVAVFVDFRMTGKVPEHFQYGPLATFCLIFHLIPGFALTIRRLHDVGRSGWWWLLSFVPIIGAVVLLFWECCPSEAWANDYGDPPGTGGGQSARTRRSEVNPIIERALRTRSSRPPNVAAVDPGSISTQRFI